MIHKDENKNVKKKFSSPSLIDNIKQRILNKSIPTKIISFIWYPIFDSAERIYLAIDIISKF